MRLLVALAALLACAAPARAATFGLVESSSCERGGCLTVATATFTGAPGEANRVTLAEAGSELVARDEGAPLLPGAGCRALDAASVACRRTTALRVETGDGDDVLTGALPATALVALLGPGDDRFTGAGNVAGEDGGDVLAAAGSAAVQFDGGAGDDVLTGGPGPDSLAGGPGADALSGGAGDDVLTPADTPLPPAREVPADDRADGGPGRDLLSYANRGVPVVVDLGDGLPEGAPGERDVATGIEDVQGGALADRLTGDTGPNRLSGDSGADVLEGAGGNDRLDAGVGLDDRAVLRGGPGNDLLSGGAAAILLDGGPGDDRLLVPPGGAECACGTGEDLAAASPFGSGLELRLRGCERVPLDVREPHTPVLTLPASPGGPADAFRLSCPAAGPGGTCRARLQVRGDGGALLGTARATLAPGAAGALRVRYPRRAARNGALRAWIEVSRAKVGRVTPPPLRVLLAL